jgi:protein SCO1/2
MTVRKGALVAMRLLTVFFAAGAIYFGFQIWQTLEGPTFGGDFALTYRGNSWNFSSEAKKLNLLYFGYTQCPDVCPMSLSHAGDAFRRLTAQELKDVRFVFLSVDQAHDKPDEVADYAQNFFPEFIGLSGSKEQIDYAIGLFPASYMVEENPKSYLGYSIAHTDRIFFLNSKGILIDSISGSKEGADAIYKKIKENL